MNSSVVPPSTLPVLRSTCRKSISTSHRRTPAKSTDSRFGAYFDRFGDESWELDALDPTVIADLIRAQVESLRDEDKWQIAVEEENEHRKLLSLVSDQWNDVAAFVENNQ